MKKLVAAMGLLAVVLAVVAVAPTVRNAFSQGAAKVDPMLKLCQDESTIEKQIVAYLKEVKDIGGAILRYNDKEKKDLIVAYLIDDLDGLPEFRAVVDTLVAEKNDKGVVTERVVMVQSFYELPASAKTADVLAKIHALNSKWMDGQWSPGGVYVDSDGDVCWRTAYNIPAKDVGLHAEMVYDALARMVPFWKSYYPQLKAILDAAAPKEAP